MYLGKKPVYLSRAAGCSYFVSFVGRSHSLTITLPPPIYHACINVSLLQKLKVAIKLISEYFYHNLRYIYSIKIKTVRFPVVIAMY